MNGSSTTPQGQTDIPGLSRVTFFEGQRLLAGDLNDAATIQRELRWLHNRSLHNWGIGLGFAVSGDKGDRQVQITPGYALDCRGREIILTEAISKAVPARAGRTVYYLVAAYPGDTQLTVLEQRRGECQSIGAVRWQERAAIYWKAQGEQSVESGMEIVLAQATVEDCQLAASLSLAQRRSARVSQQPLVVAGTSPKGQTPWELWTVQLNNADDVRLGVKVQIYTEEARFGATPEYQAQLRGDRLIPTNILDPIPSEQLFFYLDGTTFISAASRTSFTLHVLMPMMPGYSSLVDDSLVLKIVRERWWVVWIGVEG